MDAAIRKVKLALLGLLLLFVALITVTAVFWGVMSWLVAAMYVLTGAVALILGLGFGVYVVVRGRRR
ncbi:MAG: hypothetical protein QF719_04545 [Chloroflexota bacterium]|nr:hypothetical protein [Chloroflexota bacterium]MDP6509424.1 hypothetical protein [Chloroflexota bacterium]MDP6757467.1 hypothetical protein [Chloroflexota bacterium]